MKKRIVLITIAICLAAPLLWAGSVQDKIKGVIAKAAAPAGSTTEITVDFSGSLDDWADEGSTGTWSISDGVLHHAEGGTTYRFLRYTAGNLSSVNGWLRFKINDWSADSEATGAFFRSASDGTGYRYAIVLRKGSATNIYWSIYSGTSWSSDPDSSTDEPEFTTGDTCGITWTGTGTDTVIRVFRNMTNATPSSATSWDSASDFIAEFDADPGAGANDTGTYVGLTSDEATDNEWDDFKAGTF